MKQREKHAKDVKTPLHAPNGTTSARFWQRVLVAAGASAVYAQFGTHAPVFVFQSHTHELDLTCSKEAT
jgi:hypothetical protein